MVVLLFLETPLQELGGESIAIHDSSQFRSSRTRAESQKKFMFEKSEVN